MKIKVWVLVMIGLAVTAGIVSFAVAHDVRGTGSDNSDAGISPAAGNAEVKSVIWYKNGVQQGTLNFEYSWSASIDVNPGDTVMFRVKCRYSGPGKGYMVFRDVDSGYQESMFLPSGVTSTKNVVRSFSWESTAGSPHSLWVNAFGSGDGRGLGDENTIFVNVL